MASIRNVAGTAFVVAEYRNDENREAVPLYRDPYVRLFLDEETKLAADRISESFPPIRINVRLRTRYFDDWLDRCLRQGSRQVVILGAGLDTRPQRWAAPDVTFFEIDAPETQALKRAKLAAGGVDPNTCYIGANYVTDGLLALLSEQGFDAAVPTHVIWEGNTMYLSEASVRQVLDDLMQKVQRCSLSFDYLAEEVVEGKTGDSDITAVVERFAAMGAPWTYGVNNIDELAIGCGAQMLDNVRLSQLHRTYWPTRPLASPLYDYYRLCTLQNATAS
jgi:methyltransferase (TIGR00027 family)